MGSVSAYLPIAPLSVADGNVHNSYLIAFLNYFYLYGCQIVVLAVLSVMAAFRREFSSNRVYMERQESSVNGESETVRSSRTKAAWKRLVILDQDEIDIDNMLEGAGNIYGPIFSMTLAIWGRVTFARLRCKSDIEAGNSAFSENHVAKFSLGAQTAGTAGVSLSFSQQTGVNAIGDLDYASGDGDGEEHDGKYNSYEENVREPLRQSANVLNLPPDSHIHILSFLHPCDVLRFACTSQGTRIIVDDESVGGDGNSVSFLLWKELWKRDFAWVVREWDVGKQALARSMGLPSGMENLSDNCGSQTRKMASIFKHLQSSVVEKRSSDESAPIIFGGKGGINHTERYGGIGRDRMPMKDFYFMFGESWLNYTLAGQNTSARCLVGLHGHVFDITDFFEQHPGSPEILLVQSGRDATAFFEDLGHSVGARRMAMTMCVVLDRSCVAGIASNRCGLLGAGSKETLTTISSTRNLPKPSWARSETARNAMPFSRSKPRRSGTLHRIRTKFDREERCAQLRAETWLSGSLTRNGILGNIHVYYDMFLGRWMAWYTNMDSQPVFVDEIVDS